MRMSKEVEIYRSKKGGYGSPEGYSCGFFEIPHRSNTLRALVYDGKADGWEHVSVSLKNRNPNYEEMCYIKDLFWDEEECVIQYHVPKSQHISNHPYCLHLWRKIDGSIEMPPSCTVGFKELNGEFDHIL
jgi:hypothetical protein